MPGLPGERERLSSLPKGVLGKTPDDGAIEARPEGVIFRRPQNPLRGQREAQEEYSRSLLGGFNSAGSSSDR